MIASVKGKLIEIGTDHAVLETAGVGYELFCSTFTLENLFGRLGEDFHLWVYTHVREDAMTLFGFQNKEEKQMFLSLLKVNGIGPKMAMTILSAARVDDLHRLIEASDAKGLSGLPRLGKKTAEQIILTLKGKLVRVQAAETKNNSEQIQIKSALLNLGFKLATVEDFIVQLPPETELEEGIRKGLLALSRA